MKKLIAKLQSRSAEMYVSKVVWVLATIIVGCMLMWGVYQIFAETVLPGLDDQINDIFANGNDAISSGNAKDYEGGGYTGGDTN